MELLKLLFLEKSGFSWRKALTALTALTFVTACIGYLITNDFKELPGSYQAIIGGVFVFYFGKGFFEGKQIKLEDK
jgi:putative Mn2+ efflux pump MntP